MIGTPFSVALPVAPPEYDTPQLQLFFFACDGNVEGIAAALEAGAKIDALSPNGFNALHYAVVLNRIEAVSLLLKSGADPDAISDRNGREMNGPNALSLATIYDYQDIVEVLLEAGADSMRTEYDKSIGMRPVAYAALHNRLDIVRRMEAAGADVRQPVTHLTFGDGNTWEVSLLAIAARHGGLEVIRYLVETHGLSVNHGAGAPNSSPLWNAAKHGNYEVAKYLIERGADVNIVNTDSRPHDAWRLSCLGVAARYGWHDVSRLLLESGAKVHTNDRSVRDPILIADEAGYSQVAELYQQLGYASSLWERHAARNRSARMDGRQLASVSGSDAYAASLLEGEWPGRSGRIETDGASDAPVTTAILADGGSADLSAMLAVELTAHAQHIHLLEREHMDVILAEHALSLGGLTDEKDLSSYAKLLGAEALIVVKTLNLESQTLHEVKLVNAIQGIRMNTKYCPADRREMMDFAAEYAATGSEALRHMHTALEDVIPVSLVNVRSDHGTAEGIIVERNFQRTLAMNLSDTPGVLLLERENLEALVMEKEMEGHRAEFVASAAFIDLRLNLNFERNAVQTVTLRIEDADGGKVVTEIDGDSEGPMEMIEQVRSSISSQLSLAPGSTTQRSSLLRDAGKLKAEARWLAGVGLYEEALSRIKDVIALDGEDLGAWMMYKEFVRELVRKTGSDRGDDAVNRRRLELERERLSAMDGFWALWASDAPSDRLGVSANRAVYIGWCFMWFGDALDHFRPVFMRQRYAEELRSLEQDFVRFLERRVLPFYENPDHKLIERLTQGNDAKQVLAHILSPLPYFSPEGVAEAEPVVRAMLKGGAEVETYRNRVGRMFFWRTAFTAPNYGGHWDWDLLSWMEASGETFLSCRYIEGFRTLRQEPFSKYRAFSVGFQQGIDSRLRASLKSDTERVFGRVASMARPANPLDLTLPLGEMPMFELGVMIDNWTHVYRSQEAEAAHLAYFKRGGAELSLRAASFNYPQIMLEAAKSVALRLENKERKDANNQRILFHFNQRLEVMGHARNDYLGEEKPLFGDVPVRIWHPSLYGFPEFTIEHVFLHRFVFSDNHWWRLGRLTPRSTLNRKVRSKTPEAFMLFKVDAETLKTTAKRFTSAELLASGRYDGASVGDRWMAIWEIPRVKQLSGDEGSFLFFLNTETAEIRGVHGYVPVRQGVAVGDDFYCLMEPVETYRGPWEGSGSPDQLLMLKFHMPTGSYEVLFNTRRNPPVTIMDRPPSNQYFPTYHPDKQLILLDRIFVYDIETGQFRRMNSGEVRQLQLEAVGADGLRTGFVVDDGRWFSTNFLSEETRGLEANMSAFRYVRLISSDPSVGTGRQDKKAIQWSFENPAENFEPYRRYQVAFDEGKFSFRTAYGSTSFTDKFGLAVIGYPISSRGYAISFSAFFLVDDFRAALESARSLWGNEP